MDPFADRVERLERALSDAGASAALVSSGANAYYFSGFAGERDRHLLLLLTPTGKRTFVSPSAYVGQVRENAWIDDVRSVPANRAEDVIAGVVEELPAGDGPILLDGAMPAEITLPLGQALPDASFGQLDDLVVPLRASKAPEERKALRKAARSTDEVSEEIRSFGEEAIGMTEAELAAEIRVRLVEKGAERVAFPIVVAAGPNSARPTQYRHGTRTIRPGEPVVVDFGGFFDHYASDQTRVIVFDGDPPEEFIQVFPIVRDALRTGIEAAEPGMTAGELDGIVRGVIEEGGYGEQFTTGTGHGIGLRAHEYPSIDAGEDTVLRPGMTFSLEPGIYLQGEFGVRLETIVNLTSDGAEALNTSPLTWRQL